MICTGYHATPKFNKNNILENGFSKSLNNKDNPLWLGEGVYFWNSLYYAVEWNVIKLKKNTELENNFNNLMENYLIFKVDIECDEEKLLDLSGPEGSIIFKEFKKQLLSRDNTVEQQEKFQKNIDNDIFWIFLMFEEGVFDDYYVLTATYYKKIDNNGIEYGSNFLKYLQSQICVLKNECIKNTRVYENNNKQEYLYRVIMNNRNYEYEVRRKIWIK